MMSVNDMRGARSAKAKAAAELSAKPVWEPATDQPVYDALMAEVDDWTGRIDRAEDMRRIAVYHSETHAVADAAARASGATGSEGRAIYNKWLRKGDAGLSAEDFTTIRNTMSTTTGSEGGYTVATEVATSVLDALKAFGGMRSVAEIIRSSGTGDLSFPASDGTSETGELIGQNTTATAADVAFSTIPLVTYKFSSKFVSVPFELLQDSNVDIEAFVQTRLATRLARITNTYFTTGTGTAQPKGLMAAATVGVTAANSTTQVTAITYDSLVDLMHSVDPEYRALGNCKFMMNDASVKVIRKIKDQNLRPIFVPGYETGVPGGAPDTLLGAPVVINQDIAVMGASAKSIAYGDLSFYKIRDVMDVSMFRFTDSTFTKLGQVGFLAWMRSGGNLVDVGGAVKVFVNAAS
jgi:HK97 family phage major capsid protein